MAARWAASVTESGLVIFGDVLTDTKASYPDIPLIGGLAAAFGLALGVVSALFTEMTERRVRGPEDLQFSSRVPIIGSVGDGPVPVRRQRRWLPRRWLPRFAGGGSLQPAE